LLDMVFGFRSCGLRPIIEDHRLCEFGIEFFCAIGANAVAELGLGMILHIFFDFLPKPFVVSDILTLRTDRHKSSQGFHFIQGILQRRYILEDDDRAVKLLADIEVLRYFYPVYDCLVRFSENFFEFRCASDLGVKTVDFILQPRQQFVKGGPAKAVRFERLFDGITGILHLQLPIPRHAIVL
jgi:hypothetical protein